MSIFPQRRGRAAIGAVAIAAGTMVTTFSAGTAVSAAASSRANTNLSGVTLNIGNIDGSGEIPWVLANFKTPYKVNWVAFTDSPPLLQALQANAINFALPGITGVIDGQLNGLSFKIVAEYASPGGSMALLTPKGSKLTNVAQLKGKNVAVFKGSAGEGFLVEALKRAGLTEDQVTVVNLQPAAAAPAFAKGDFAAWAIWVPFSTIAEAQGAKVLETGAFWPEVGYFAAKPSTLANPADAAAISNFLSLFKKALGEETVAGIAKQYELQDHLSAAEALPIAQATIGEKELPINAATYTNYVSTIDTFAAAHLVPGKPSDPLSVFETVFNSAIG